MDVSEFILNNQSKDRAFKSILKHKSSVFELRLNKTSYRKIAEWLTIVNDEVSESSVRRFFKKMNSEYLAYTQQKNSTD